MNERVEEIRRRLKSGSTEGALEEALIALAQAEREMSKWKKAYDGLLAEADREGPPMYSQVLQRAERAERERDEARAEVERLKGLLEYERKLARNALEGR